MESDKSKISEEPKTQTNVAARYDLAFRETKRIDIIKEEYYFPLGSGPLTSLFYDAHSDNGYQQITINVAGAMRPSLIHCMGKEREVKFSDCGNHVDCWERGYVEAVGRTLSLKTQEFWLRGFDSLKKLRERI